ncbi:hypothetical protein [Vibrio crassostreae]|uniref:hypothetical protein n=1 Tax=Vibrio crassostreae TaxID=246167 RepID=UPI001B305356|nr:hypothetical protein [Vibrio crassostreae]
MSEFKCSCGKDLKEYEGSEESCSISADCAHWDFICEDEDCGKRYSIEFHPINGDTCDCGGDLVEDNNNPDGNVFVDSINMPFVCAECGEEHSLEFHPVHMTKA